MNSTLIKLIATLVKLIIKGPTYHIDGRVEGIVVNITNQREVY